jgi:cobalt/nickel transport system ATP-binding protein
MVSLDKVTLEFDDGSVPVEKFSLEVSEGESVAIVGGNGAGKTALLHAIVGLVKIRSGKMTVAKLAMNKGNLLEIRRKVGLLFQNPDDQLFMPTALDDVSFAPINCKFDAKEAEKKAKRMLKYLNISELKDRSPMRLSGGEKRLLALAGILVMEPEIILLDEPSAYLDARSKGRLAEIIRELPQTKLIASQDADFCGKVCDRSVALGKRKLKS